jgi:hypothetical protein
MMARTGSTDSRRNMKVRASADFLSTHCRSSITTAGRSFGDTTP